MSATLAQIVAAGKLKAQNATTVPLITGGSGDDAFNEAVGTALSLFSQHRSNLRVVHHTVSAAGFRFVLSGAGAILTGADAWVNGASQIGAVWLPYDSTLQGQQPIDSNLWRTLREPSSVVLEVLEMSASIGDVLRLEFVKPHAVGASAADTTIEPGDLEAFETLVASIILTTAAARYAQNTGTSSLTGDVVDRRSQADIMASRAKDLMTLYRQMMGIPSDGAGAGGNATAVRPGSAIKEFDVSTSHQGGFLWHRPSVR